jgi:hypothetical protein
VLVWNKQRVADSPVCRTPGTGSWPSAGAAKIGQWVRAATLGTLNLRRDDPGKDRIRSCQVHVDKAALQEAELCKDITT